jgi:hypothetical protein
MKCTKIFLALLLLTISPVISSSDGQYGAPNFDISPSFEDIQSEVRRQLAIYVFGDPHHQVALESLPVTEYARNQYFFTSNQLFVKVTELIEVDYLNKVMSHFQEHYCPYLCLPLQMQKIERYGTGYSILIFPKAEGIDFYTLYKCYQSGQVISHQLDMAYTSLGVAVANLHRAGGLEIEGQQLRTHCIHKDLHGENILYGQTVQIIDFSGLVESLERREKTCVERELKRIFAETLLCYELFYDNVKQPEYCFISSFISGYVRESGLPTNIATPIMYRYAMNCMMQEHQKCGADDSDIPSINERSLKPSAKRLEVINGLNLFLRSILNIPVDYELAN